MRSQQSWLVVVAGRVGLRPAQRIHSIVTAVERVRTTLSALPDPGRDAIELAGVIEGWTVERLTQPR